jgi:hypothetical protein
MWNWSACGLPIKKNKKNSDGVFFDSQTKNARKVHLAVKMQLPK